MTIPKSKFFFMEFFTRKIVLRFLKFTCIVMPIEFFFAIGLLINKDLGFSEVYIAGIFIYSFQCLSYIGCVFYFYIFKRKRLNVFTNLSILVFSILILLLSILSKCYFKDPNTIRILKGFETGNIKKPLDWVWFSVARFNPLKNLNFIFLWLATWFSFIWVFSSHDYSVVLSWILSDISKTSFLHIGFPKESTRLFLPNFVQLYLFESV